MPSIDFRELRARITMSQVLELLQYKPRRRLGDQLRGPCPIHRSSSPTSRVFAVHLRQNVFQCFAPTCQAKGNHLDLWAQVNGLPIYDAAVDLCDKLGVIPPTIPWR